MMDTCKALGITRESYLWEWTVPQINLARYDSTHIEYSKDKKGSKKDKPKEKTTVFNSVEDIVAVYGNGILID